MFRIKANGGRDLRQRDLTVTLPFGNFLPAGKILHEMFFYSSRYFLLENYTNVPIKNEISLIL